jgi:dUTP pyrophosphatase
MTSSNQTLKIKKFYEDAQIPKRATPGSAGYDLYAYEDYTIEPGQVVYIDTGVGFTVPDGTYGRIAPRSGLAKHKLFVNAGVVDQDFFLVAKVVMQNLNTTAYEVKKGDRVAQLIIEQIQTPEIELVEELVQKERLGGFGSTGY